MDLEVLWSNVLDKIKEELSSLSFETWFSDTKLYKLEDGKAIIIVPMAIHKKHLADNYSSILSNKINEVVGSSYELEFLLEEEIETEEAELVEQIKEEATKNNKPTPVETNLNPNLNFENFVVGNSNKFAHAAALSVAENPGTMYNPLFIYGNSGLGKTHLMEAIGNYIFENSNKRVLYVQCEQFKDDYISIMKKGEDGTNFNYVDFFRDKYRNIDVLIIDDIQFLAGSNKTQHEFFNTFNTLFNNSKQIIISSDRSPDDLKNLEDRLRTRFCWGLTVNIYPPDAELRKEILRKKIKAAEFPNEIPDDVIQYMASNIGSNVRQLEGAVNRLGAYSAIMGGLPITLDLAIDALKDFVSKGMGENNDIHRIQRIVAEYFQISVDDIKSKKRSANIAFPRQIAMYLCRTMTDESFPKIGIEFGGKDHSTIMYSVEKIESEMKVNKDLANIIEKLQKDIGGV